MRPMIFVRGVLGVCPRCGGEITVEQHVRQVVPALDGLEYLLIHSCGWSERRTLDRTEHSQVTRYLRQVAQGQREDGPALSTEETLMREFHTRLDMILTGDDIERALNRGAN